MLHTIAIGRNNVELVRTSMSGSAFLQAHEFARASGRKLISCRKAGELLSSGRWIDYEYGFPAWTGTLVAYPEAGKGFGIVADVIDPVANMRFRVDIPHGIAGTRGRAIVLESGTYDVHGDGRQVVFVPKGEIIVIEDFPQERAALENPVLGRGIVCRAHQGGIFAVVRDTNTHEHGAPKSRQIDLDFNFSRKLGVMVEGPLGSIPPEPLEESYTHSSGGD
jgi:hypothetical protein